MKALKPYRDHPEETAKARELERRLWDVMIALVIAGMEADARLLAWMADRKVKR